jgi:hypothetical protein
MVWNVMECYGAGILPTVQPATIALSVTTSPTKPESPKSYPGVQPAADGNRLESVPLLDWPKNCYENVTACPDAALRPVVAYNPA